MQPQHSVVFIVRVVQVYVYAPNETDKMCVWWNCDVDWYLSVAHQKQQRKTCLGACCSVRMCMCHWHLGLIKIGLTHRSCASAAVW